MRVSPKKRHANRCNAQKSTGPKTETGRQASARNAARHGLSVPLNAHVNEPLQQELAQLIESDELSFESLMDLAQKIIDYERNMAYLREIYKRDMLVLHKEIPSIPPKKSISGYWQKRLKDELADIHDKWLKGMPWEESNMTRLAIQVNQRIMREQKNEVRSSQRYFKRSSNQLIKALKKL